MSVAVVHLASGSLGVEPLEAFVRSYRAHDAGASHRLVVVFNRFEDASGAAGHRAALEAVEHEELWPDEPLQDLAAYLLAAARLDAERLCFLNSGSEILADGWLAALDRHTRRPEVGLAGATGTYESHVSGALHAPDRGALVRAAGGLLTWRSFPRFPNPHVRTNAFMAQAQTIRGLRLPDLASKHGAHMLESGRRSITRQVLASGRQAVVVGRDGEAYPPERWPASRTFRSGEQENLLVADRRTREYGAADAGERARLAALAWGGSA